MATLTDIETQVLEEIGENLTTAIVWDGSTELREALADGLDELGMLGKFFERSLVLALEADVSFYSLSCENFYPFYIKRATLLDQNRELDCDSLIRLAGQDKKFLISRASPRQFIPLSSELIMIYPCYAAVGGAVQLDMVGVPSHYATATEYVGLQEELEQALIHYGKYHLMLRAGGLDGMAMQEYEFFLKAAGADQQYAHHRKALREYRLKEFGEA